MPATLHPLLDVLYYNRVAADHRHPDGGPHAGLGELDGLVETACRGVVSKLRPARHGFGQKCGQRVFGGTRGRSHAVVEIDFDVK